jgi:hypothetical protein
LTWPSPLGLQTASANSVLPTATANSHSTQHLKKTAEESSSRTQQSADMIIRVSAQNENISYYFYLIKKEKRFAMGEKEKKHRGPGGGEKAVEKNHTHRMDCLDLT